MRLSRVLLLTFLLMRPVCAAYGDPVSLGKLVDPTNFDIAGVKLYMTGQQVVDALQSTFGRSIVSKAKAELSNSILRPGTQYIKEIDLEVEGAKYMAFLVETPDAAECVWQVELWSRPLITDADKAQFKATVIEKYGPTTLGDSWCSKVNMNRGPFFPPACISESEMGFGMVPFTSRGRLLLKDIRPLNAQDAAQKQKTTQGPPKI